MNLGEITQRVHIELGEQSTFYPADEVRDMGVNPAERLLTLAYPLLLQRRTLVEFSPDALLSDLRIFAPGVRRVNRVVLGDVTANETAPVSATGELRRLTRTHLERLAGRPGWINDRGRVRMYWTFGAFWLGLYRRPFTDVQVTVIYDAIPKPMVFATDVPSISSIYHQALVDIATGLLLVKEGAPESTRGLDRVREALKGVSRVNMARTA